MRKVVLPLAFLSSVFADGPAHAQCAPEDKIYIDPRLVPQRPSVPEGSIGGIRPVVFSAPRRSSSCFSSTHNGTSPLVRARSWCTQPILALSNIFREPLRPS